MIRRVPIDLIHSNELQIRRNIMQHYSDLKKHLMMHTYYLRNRKENIVLNCIRKSKRQLSPRNKGYLH